MIQVKTIVRAADAAFEATLSLLGSTAVARVARRAVLRAAIAVAWIQLVTDPILGRLFGWRRGS